LTYQSNKQKEIMTTATVREIRKMLFDTDKFTVIESEEMNNNESRDFLYNKENQEEKMNVIDNHSHLLIWKC
tara:strand:+ start:3093 stop:3308 length:216 start_codon:yes stop_codon:yes gene_type:complete